MRHSETAPNSFGLPLLILRMSMKHKAIIDKKQSGRLTIGLPRIVVCPQLPQN